MLPKIDSELRLLQFRLPREFNSLIRYFSKILIFVCTSWNANSMLAQESLKPKANLTKTTNCTFYETAALAKAAVVDPATTTICITSYAESGDSPIRWMTRLSTPPNPVQPWHLQTSEGTYWQDTDGDFYPEFLGATVKNPDCSTALQDAFRAHMHLKMRLRGMGNVYTCAKQVHFDTTGFIDGGCDVDFNGTGRSRISFSLGVPSPCFLLAASGPQNDFWGRFLNLEIDANVNGIAAQFGRSDLSDPSNDFEIYINVKNNSKSKYAQALVMNAFYSSWFNITGNCGGIGTGLTAIQLNRCNMCSGFVAVGNGNNGLVFSNYTNGNSFAADIEVLTTGIIQLDATCGSNEIMCGAISNLTNAIDNHRGGPLRLRNITIGGVKNIFANPSATDSTWGGHGVTLDDAGQNPTQFDPGGMPRPNVWVLNKSGQPQWISLFGPNGSDRFEVYVRYWWDYSSKGVMVANSSPCGFIIQPGEKVSINYKKTVNKVYSWSWRPML
ncbi:MAG: hypothetical protein H0T62_13645 [Parachlamydiaceae bacterium]|nr:hypothetical protein [Parachlamydiaceae bacterium]